MSKFQNIRILPVLLIGLGSAFFLTAAYAGEGGTSHIMPGANATLVD